MNVGVDCKNLVQNIFIETGHSNLVSGGNLPTVSYLDKYWKSNGLDREDMSHGTGVYPPVSVVHYKTNCRRAAG